MSEIFLNNKYTRWYYALIEQRKNNPANSDHYREDHHVVPESFYIVRKREGPAGWLEGDADAKENKVWLTGREHALCHWLLVKMTRGVAHIKCRQAFDMMASDNCSMNRKVSRMITRAYERNRIEIAKIRSERMTENNPMDNEESRKRVGDSKRGKSRSEFGPDWRASLRASNSGSGNGMYNKSHRDSTKSLISLGNSDREWIHKDDQEKKVKSTIVDDWLLLGWQRGRTPTLKKNHNPKPRVIWSIVVQIHHQMLMLAIMATSVSTRHKKGPSKGSFVFTTLVKSVTATVPIIEN
jgi:hypothetical protein